MTSKVFSEAKEAQKKKFKGEPARYYTYNAAEFHLREAACTAVDCRIDDLRAVAAQGFVTTTRPTPPGECERERLGETPLKDVVFNTESVSIYMCVYEVIECKTVTTLYRTATKN